MIYRHPFFDSAISTGEGKITSVVIENPAAFAEILRDIASSIDGNEEQSVLFREDKMLSFSTSAELLSSFFPFDLNRKPLLNRIVAALEKEATSPDLRSFLNEEETEAFFQSVVLHEFSVVMFENREYPKNKWEKRLILDRDLCIIE